LESKVEEKTKALLLTNEELRCAKTRADKALASRDKFIKDSIHEINTPLNVIQANIELLRLGGINNKNLVKIEAASKIISAIYDDLSYFIKKDRFLVKKEVINFSDFLSSRLEYFKEVAEGANIKIVQKITEQLFVSFDITQLQRMCDNNIFYHPDLSILRKLQRGRILKSSKKLRSNCLYRSILPSSNVCATTIFLMQSNTQKRGVRYGYRYICRDAAR
jgi:hypothetical protein